jgi:hypothetical protein
LKVRNRIIATITIGIEFDAIRRIEIDAVIASHLRLANHSQVRYDWQHYVPLLERKPGALRNGAPFADLPEPLQSAEADEARTLAFSHETSGERGKQAPALRLEKDPRSPIHAEGWAASRARCETRWAAGGCES